MKDFKSRTLVIGSATACAVALLAWSAELLPNFSTLHTELHFALGVSLALAVVLAVLGARQFASRQQQSQQFFDLLLRSGPEQLRRLASGADPLPVSLGNPVLASAQNFAERFAQNCEKLEHTASSRTRTAAGSSLARAPRAQLGGKSRSKRFSPASPNRSWQSTGSTN